MANNSMCRGASVPVTHKPVLIAPHLYMQKNVGDVKSKASFSHQLELAAEDDIERFQQLIKQDASAIDDVPLWYERKKGSKAMAIEHRTPILADSRICCGALEPVTHKPVLIAPHEYMQKNITDVKSKLCVSYLLELAADDDIERFQQLIKQDPSAIDEVAPWYERKKGTKGMAVENRTPLLVGSSFGSLRVVEFILSYPAVNVNRPCGADKITALHCAASSGTPNAIEVVKLLLKSGANRNLVDARGKRPFDLILVSPSLKQMKFSLQLLLAEPNPFSPQEKPHKPLEPVPDPKSVINSRDQDFLMFSYKIKPCTLPHPHDWKECSNLHPGELTRRRDPRVHNYSSAPCTYFQRGNCTKGDTCKYAHGLFESGLHPTKYKTEFCKDGMKCNRKSCFYAHKKVELRSPSSPSMNYASAKGTLITDSTVLTTKVFPSEGPNQSDCAKTKEPGNLNNLSWVNKFLKETSQETKIRSPGTALDAAIEDLVSSTEGSLSYTHIDPITSWEWLSKHNGFNGAGDN